MDYMQATRTGGQYVGFIDDVRTLQADKDMVARVLNLLIDVESFRAPEVGGVEAPHRKTFSSEMKMALEGQLVANQALAIYKEWKIENGYSNTDKYHSIAEKFKVDHAAAAIVLDKLSTSTNTESE